MTSPDTSPVVAEIEHLQRYLTALETAHQALDDARRLYPDFGLDHALDRLRQMVAEASQRLITLLDQIPECELPEANER
jgi:hypothetical protein